MKPFFIFCFFPFFRQIAKRKVLVFCSQCFAYYTTTRENRELRRRFRFNSRRCYYTTTRENRELRRAVSSRWCHSDYTTTRENRELRPSRYKADARPELYHYERKQGTTTVGVSAMLWSVLYHYERKQGTTTEKFNCFTRHRLYHYERKQGTTTEA